MSFQPRQYQWEAIQAGLNFFHDRKEKKHGILILPTGSGKSVVIANITGGLTGKTLVFQPSKEILEQNFAKYMAYGYRAGIYSASAGMKYLDDVTFVTIGSVAKKQHLFRDVKNIIVDECHLVNPAEGMYEAFFNSIPGVKVLGLTATPYRLAAGFEGAELRFITRQSPRMFSKVLYCVQTKVLFEAGHLAPLRYFSFDKIDRSMLETNSGGTDFRESSLRAYYRKIDMPSITIEYAERLLKKRRNLLTFCSLVEEAERVARAIPGSEVVTGETPGAQRDKILKEFKADKIRHVVNVGVLTTGFDYPALECALMARSTMSLAVYYQIIGRIMRPYKYADGTIKEGWFVDLGSNVKLFGKIEDMVIRTDDNGKYAVYNDAIGRQLTNVPFLKEVA